MFRLMKTQKRNVVNIQIRKNKTSYVESLPDIIIKKGGEEREKEREREREKERERERENENDYHNKNNIA